MIVDPAWDVKSLVEHVEDKDYTIKAAFATHYHPDPWVDLSVEILSGISDLMEIKPLKVYANKLESDGLKKVTSVSDSDIVEVDSGDKMVSAIRNRFPYAGPYTGSQCFRVKNTLISGDTLFIQVADESIFQGLIQQRCITTKSSGLQMKPLFCPDTYGSTPNATLGKRKDEYYLNIKDLETWQSIMGE